jgi:hypothetical protein
MTGNLGRIQLQLLEVGHFVGFHDCGWWAASSWGTCSGGSRWISRALPRGCRYAGPAKLAGAPVLEALGGFPELSREGADTPGQLETAH